VSFIKAYTSLGTMPELLTIAKWIWKEERKHDQFFIGDYCGVYDGLCRM